MRFFDRLREMILKPQNRVVLSGDPRPPGIRETEKMVGEEVKAEAIRKRAEKARQRLETGQGQPQEPVLPEEGDLVEQVETPQIAALQGNFREFIERNPSERMIEAWIKTHRVD